MKPIKKTKTPPAQSFHFPPRLRGIKGEFSGFTLVELIVVITILAILGTIGFMSFNGYQSSARDGVRVSDMKNIETGLELSIVKTGTYPTPDDSVSYTGGTNSQIIQGYVGDRVSQAARVNKTPLDPLNSNRYVYSTSGDGRYYQLAVTKENFSFTPIISQVYADTPGVMVRGNYIFDPSLPSLLVVSGSVNTNSGIFDPSVCFIVDGGTNTISSTSSDCIKKKDMSLKNLDNSLVGYWDMESLTSGGLLKDLSGNGNDGVFSGTVLPTSTGGIVGKGLYFSSGMIDCGSGNSLYIKDEMTILTIIRGETNTGLYPRIINKSGEYLFTINYDGDSYNNSFGVNIYGSGAGTYDDITPNSANNTLNIGNNYFLAANLKNKTVKLFLNGKILIFSSLDPNSNSLFGGIKNTFSRLYIGNYIVNGSRQFNGIIDDIKIYNRALSDGEILQQARVAGF